MGNKEKAGKDKKHADFQDSYRRSSNFNNPIKDEDFKIKKNGKLKMRDQKQKKGNELDESEKQRIADAMDTFDERDEKTPEEEQEDETGNTST